MKGDGTFAAGTNIKAAIDGKAKNNVFIWSDNLHRRGDSYFFTPVKDNTFLVRAAGGVGIGTSNPAIKGVDVNGLVQIGDELNLKCDGNTKGAMKFSDKNGCFCHCDGRDWVAMTPSQKCIAGCAGKELPVVHPDAVNAECGAIFKSCAK